MSLQRGRLLFLTAQYASKQSEGSWLLPLSHVAKLCESPLGGLPPTPLPLGGQQVHTQSTPLHTQAAHDLDEVSNSIHTQLQLGLPWILEQASPVQPPVHRHINSPAWSQQHNIIMPDVPSTVPLAAPTEFNHDGQVDGLYRDYMAGWSRRDTHTQQQLQQRDDHFEIFKEQLRSEVRAFKAGSAKHSRKVQSAVQAGVGLKMARPRVLLNAWSRSLAEALEQKLKQVRVAATPHHNRSDGATASDQAATRSAANTASLPQSVIWPMVAVLDTHTTAEIITQVFLQRILLMMGRPSQCSVTAMATAVADAVQDAIRCGHLHDELRQRSKQSREHAMGLDRLQKILTVLDRQQHLQRKQDSKSRGSRPRSTQRQIAALLSARTAADAILGNTPWPWELHLQVGTELLSLLLPLATVSHSTEGLLPAVEQMMMKVNKHSDYEQRVLCPTPALVDFIIGAGNQDFQSLLDTRFMPMLVPPKPWQGMNSGGLLLAHHPAIRGYTGSDATWLATAEAQGRLSQLFQVLDTLGSTKWRVNHRVLDILEKISSHPAHQGILGIPSRDQLTMPPHPCQGSSQSPYPRTRREGRRGGPLLAPGGPLLQGEADRHDAQVHAMRMTNANLMSIATEFDMKKATARQLMGLDAFYQPHSVDFRGRAYPITGYLTHLGDDVSRGLLEFGEGRSLGQHGLRWLFIQIANCYGHGKDKLSLEGRVEFGRACLDKCLATDRDPLSDAGRWWQDGDDPWQLLATVLDVAAAIKAVSPTAHVSHLPIHQDGSCNGLQHYAALARDSGGAFAVNLIQSSQPQDVYAAVAQLVDQQVKHDAMEDHVSEALKLLQRNNNQVDRKLVKQTVMTTVYGVTFIGAKDQIANRLVERGWNNAEEVRQVSRYLASVTLKSVGKVFANAQQVMSWLADSASKVASTGQPVTWTSPMGFPIKQSYYKFPPAADVPLVVNARAQRTAFPPNYVHSLDAAHMMMTALECHEYRVTFAGVHDSFFTHAGTVDQMNTILRHEFVRLHEQPLLDNLLTEFQATGAKDLKPVPPQGNLDISCVLTSTYFFS